MELTRDCSYYILGVMSGTSVDGIDLAYVKFVKGSSWTFQILKAETLTYTKTWQKELREAINYHKEQLDLFDKKYTSYLGEQILSFLEKNNIRDLDAVASHGHTILHRPDKGYTYQIGNRDFLAQLTRQRVVCDFRVQDVALGGQGAPLVPIGDQALFGDYNACINIGGFSNISYEMEDRRIAYDICPTNIVLNKYAGMLGCEYDENGAIARNSSVDQQLLKNLNNLDFYWQQPPKSLGLEWVEEHVIPLLQASGCSVEVIIATFTEHMAIQIARIVEIIKTKKPQILITGGGAHNRYLIERIRELAGAQIVIPDQDLIEFKEALIFAFMGVLRLRNTTNVLASVTGAKENHCSGIIYTP